MYIILENTLTEARWNMEFNVALIHYGLQGAVLPTHKENSGDGGGEQFMYHLGKLSQWWVPWDW